MWNKSNCCDKQLDPLRGSYMSLMLKMPAILDGMNNLSMLEILIPVTFGERKSKFGFIARSQFFVLQKSWCNSSVKRIRTPKPLSVTSPSTVHNSTLSLSLSKVGSKIPLTHSLFRRRNDQIFVVLLADAQLIDSAFQNLQRILLVKLILVRCGGRPKMFVHFVCHVRLQCGRFIRIQWQRWRSQ